MCCGVPLLNAIQVVDASGKRLVSGWRAVQKKTRAAHPQECTCSADEIIRTSVLHRRHYECAECIGSRGYSSSPRFASWKISSASPYVPDGLIYPVMPPESERLTLTVAP